LTTPTAAGRVGLSAANKPFRRDWRIRDRL
jgi:hypothetical protein